MKGTVKWYNETKRYGFIAGEDNQDYFFHKKELNKFNNETITEKDEVEFSPKTTEKGLQAQNVTKTN